MSNKVDHSLNQALQHVDERRRGFLGKLLAGGAALASVPAMTTIALADDQPAPVGKGKGGAARGGRGGPVTDTNEIAARMIQEFDKDGDKALNQAELAAAIKAAHERDGQGIGGGKGKGGGGGAAGGGKGKGGAGGAAGGGKGKGGAGGAAGGGKGKGKGGRG